ncbi:hypothetical protein FSP39_016579 [Pinctada imbricata]|uniref:Uncharacterized protein n=1 Tax=Pinctada imbricata TaxID=66713 RepID=A0AA88YMS0_PINIB|nr:hypothetical protein FSP39_016579 [Pinctada imbricata]
MFEEYFDFDSAVLHKNDDDPLKSAIIDELQRRMIVLDIRPVNEGTIRILTDTILFKLCTKAECKIEVGTKIDCKLLMPCQFDYRIMYKGFAIGCVETKCKGGLEGKSVVQAALELLVLQAEFAEKKCPNPLPPLFSILTDGTQYIIIKLMNIPENDTKIFVFESNSESKKLFVHHFQSIEAAVNWLIPTFLALTREPKSYVDHMKADTNLVGKR